MKILFKDIKAGIVKVVPQTNDDLWLLTQLINIESLVSSKTTRKVKLTETKVEKKTYYVTITVSKVLFETDTLRISGLVQSEHDDIPKNSSHSFSIQINDELKIQQKWMKYQFEKLDDAAKDIVKILLVVLDRESVYFAKLTNSGYKLLSNFDGEVNKKIDGLHLTSKNNFYAEIIKKLKEYDNREGVDCFVVASPAFFKEDLIKQVNDQNLKKKIILATVSSVGENAFHELLKRDEVKQALKNQRFKIEMDEVDQFFVALNKNSKCTYGFDYVLDNANQGNISKVLVTTDFIKRYKEEGIYPKLENLFLLVDSIKSDIIIISSENDAGKRLDGVGGISAILRF
ncbi:MAG: mRNA surveillance protein pelota [Candidatus Woesearchaeota archaeon]